MCHISFQYWTTQMFSLISSSADILGFTFDMNMKTLGLVSQHSCSKVPREGHWERRQCGHSGDFCQMVPLHIRLSSAYFIYLTIYLLKNTSFSIFFFSFFSFYLFMRETQREAETQTEGEAGSTQGARCETWSWVSRIMPWGRGGAKHLSHLGCPKSCNF